MNRFFQAAAVALSILVPTAASAQVVQCFNHNGSTMRASVSGNSLTITYVQPRSVLRRAGVQRGTVLFRGTVGNVTHGVPSGEVYGQARVFSRYCPGSPLGYPVSGWWNDNGIFLDGRRPVHSRCQPTGRSTVDNLAFHWAGHRC